MIQRKIILTEPRDREEQAFLSQPCCSVSAASVEETARLQELNQRPWRRVRGWLFFCLMVALPIVFFACGGGGSSSGGQETSESESGSSHNTHLETVDDLSGVTVFNPNSCESSGCHGGLKVVEQIHPLFALRCIECHGGDQTQTSKALAHVSRPTNFDVFPLTAGTHKTDKAPVEKRGPRAYRQDDPTNADHDDDTLLDYRRFRNPGDLLVVGRTSPTFAEVRPCGESGCHKEIVERVTRSLHATMAGLVNGIYYANGHPGASQGRLADFVGDDTDKLATLSVVLPKGNSIVDPNFDSTIAGTVASLTQEVPRNDEALRTAKKSDPLGMLSFFIQTDCGRCHLYTEGNKVPGTFHAGGCTACHVEYRSEGFSQTFDDMIPKNETDHPFKHKLTRFPSVEQCGHCHNRGARHVPRFLGFRERPQGDNSSRILNEHGENTRVEDSVSGGRAGGFYPSKPIYFKPGDTIFGRAFDMSQFDEGFGIVKGKEDQSLWRRTILPGANPFFITDENRDNDFDETPPDIHGVRGMTCVDCHTKREMHGDGHIYTDRFHKVEITCESCHGTATAVSTLKTRSPFGNPVKGLSQNADGSFSLELNSSGNILSVPQIKQIIDSGTNSNTEGPSHLLHGRLECYTCHAKWHDQCNSCHMIVSYDSDDSGGFFQRSHLDNVVRNATQGQPRFVTTFDQLILGINNKGKIQNFHTSGQSTLYANKLVGGQGSEKNLNEGNFLEFSQCAGGTNAGGLCEVDGDCPGGGTCPALTCVGGPFDGQVAQAEGQCKACTVGRVGENCSVDSDCGTGGTCAGGSLNRVCFGGANDGLACAFDPDDPTANPDCPDGSCGVRMFNFVFSTIDEGLHLPSLTLNPMFPHTVRKIPRNCDSCHPLPAGGNSDLVDKAIGLGTGTTRVLDPDATDGFRTIKISRRVRMFTNGKGNLDIINPETNAAAQTGEEFSVNIDQFIDLTLQTVGGETKVTTLTQVRPTNHISTGPLDATAIEKILNNPQTPQTPSEPGP